MGSGTSFLVGGLLSGLGSGLTQHAAQVRENALIALRRQYQQEDDAREEQQTIASEGRAETRAIAAHEREGALKVGLLELASRHKRLEGETQQQWEERLIRIRGEESRKTATHQGGIDRSLENLRSRNDITEGQLADARKLAADAKLRGETVDHWEVTTDGKLVGLSATGKVIAKSTSPGSFNPSRGGRDEDSSDGSSQIRAAQERQGGGGSAKGEPAPKAAKPKPRDDNAAAARAKALATLGQVYANATPEEYPGLFRNGVKIPIEEAKRLIYQRYPE